MHWIKYNFFRQINLQKSSGHTVRVETGKVLENAITFKNFPSNQLFSNFFSKVLIWRKKGWFLRKNRDCFFSTFPQHFKLKRWFDGKNVDFSVKNQDRVFDDFSTFLVPESNYNLWIFTKKCQNTQFGLISVSREKKVGFSQLFEIHVSVFTI